MHRRVIAIIVLLFAFVAVKAEGDRRRYPKQVFRYTGIREVESPNGKENWAVFEPMRPIAFGVQAVTRAAMVNGDTLICEPFPHSEKVTTEDGQPATITVIRLRCGQNEFEIKGPVFEE